MLIRVFLHAEFISAMKTVPNPTIFVKNAKKKKKKRKIEKWLVLVISVKGKFWEFHWNSWAEYQKKSEKICSLDGKEDK